MTQYLPDRRHVLAGLTALVPLTALRSHVAYAAAKRGYCQPANGQGQCESHNVVDGVCYPTSNICAGRGKKNKFCCKGIAPACCQKVKNGIGKKCDPL